MIWPSSKEDILSPTAEGLPQTSPKMSLICNELGISAKLYQNIGKWLVLRLIALTYENQVKHYVLCVSNFMLYIL